MSTAANFKRSSLTTAGAFRQRHLQPHARRKARVVVAFSGSLVKAAKQTKVPTWYGDRCERRLAGERLRILAEHFDYLLIQPIHVDSTRSPRRIVAFGCVEYQIDNAQTEIRVGRIRPDNSFAKVDGVIDIFRPLCTDHWLRWSIDDLNLSDVSPQRDLFLNQNLIAYRDAWLARTFYKLLRRDERFRRLRARDLPTAFGLNTELVAIALAARTDTTDACCLDTRTYNRIWQNESGFRQLAARNARLLPLLNAYLAHTKSGLEEGAIATLRRAFTERGLSKAAWRYTVKHGSRMFRMPWAMASNHSYWDVAVTYLRTLQQAGLPPPPPPSIARAWIRIYNETIYFEDDWCEVPPAVLGACLRTADEVRASPRLVRFMDEFLKVALWGCETQCELDANQRRAGWRWLVRSAERWEVGYLADQAKRRWRSRVGCFESGDMIIKPMLSAAELVEEGRLMRNCVARYKARCASGLFRLFSVRKRQGSQPIAHIGISRGSRRQPWAFCDCKGFANQPLGPRFRLLAQEIIRRYNFRDVRNASTQKTV